MIGRRSFITGLVSLVAAPAIVRAGSLMPVKQISLRSVITPAEMGIDLYGRGPAMNALPYLVQWNSTKAYERGDMLRVMTEFGDFDEVVCI